MDDGGFEEFYVRSRDRLLVQVAALTGDLAEAHDHLQEAYVAAWQRWDRVGALDDPAAWVRRCARNRAVSRWRRARRLSPMPAADVSGVDPDQQAVLDALRRLPQREREALVLSRVVGLPVAEVAAEMGCPVGTVTSLIHRGREHLRAGLHDEEVLDGA